MFLLQDALQRVNHISGMQYEIVLNLTFWAKIQLIGNSISEKSKLEIMRFNKCIPEYVFLVLINLLVSELCHTLKCDH